ncbi:hypothetical protein DFH07DRAFT_786053, partial [Mycena maculata]
MSTGRRLDEARTGSKCPDSEDDEPTASPKCHEAARPSSSPIIEQSTRSINRSHKEVQAENDHTIARIHEGIATVQHLVDGQVGARNAFTPSRETSLSLTQNIFGGFGGNGNGGGGGVGEGPRVYFPGTVTQLTIVNSDGRQVNPGIDRIGQGMADMFVGVVELGGQFWDWFRQFMAVNRHVPHGISDHLFYVMDPIGGHIPVSLRYCHNYVELDEIIKTYLRRSPDAGARYVEHGDYSIVSQEGSFLVPAKFATTVRAGMQLEISILQREDRWPDDDVIPNTMCPHCHSPQATATTNGWFKCGNTTCERNYRIDGQDSEEHLRQQLVRQNEEMEPKLFRRVHIHIKYRSFPP